MLDPDMQDEVRVTVVATGLNRVSASKTQRPGERAPIKLVRNATTGQPEFGDFDNGGDAVSKAVGGMGLGLRRASSDTAAAGPVGAVLLGPGCGGTAERLPGHPGVPAPPGGLSGPGVVLRVAPPCPENAGAGPGWARPCFTRVLPAFQPG